MVKDHLGNMYKNEAEMCKYYGIEYNNYRSRIKHGWSQEKALTYKAKPSKKQVKDHRGNLYNSIKEMLQHYGVSRDTYLDKLRRGYTRRST